MAGDESQELFDRISEQGVDEHLLRHAEQAASQVQQVDSFRSAAEYYLESTR